ncbi:Hypothetical_protein [Hexamita inflata]|uniref:Hypothetical_protein n=1 Tax=Hexamita inflata TaxID=28002 RepID=A0AA86R9U7_9EUKA|nr:Hypothetical protein HINF_LOCUS51910 [Hexamita inflata]
MQVRRPRILQPNSNQHSLSSLQIQHRIPLKAPTQKSQIVALSADTGSNSDLDMQLSFKIESKEFCNAMINASFVSSDQNTTQHRYAKIKQLRTEIDEMGLKINKLEEMTEVLDTQVKYLAKKIRAVKIVINMNKLMNKKV